MFKTKTIIEYLLIIIIVFASHDTVLFGTNSNSLLVSIMKVTYLVLPFFLLLLVFISKKSISPLLFFTMFLLVLLILISGLSNVEPLGNYIYKLGVLITSYFIVCFIDFKSFVRIFDNIILFLVTASLILFIVQYIYPQVFRYFPIITNVSGLKFHTIFVANAVPATSQTFIRNWGIFREPGFFVIFMLISFCFNIFLYQSASKWRLIILSLGIFSTFSTTGYIAFLFIILARVTNGIIKDKKKTLGMVFTFFLALVVLIVIDPMGFVSNAFSKFSESSNSYGSYMARYASFIVNLFFLLKNPLFGYGIYNTLAHYPIYSYQFFNFRVLDLSLIHI